MSDEIKKQVDAWMRVMDETGWGSYIIRRRADVGRAQMFGRLGIISSMDLEPGEDEWKLNLTLAGNALRRHLMELEASHD